MIRRNQSRRSPLGQAVATGAATVFSACAIGSQAASKRTLNLLY